MQINQSWQSGIGAILAVLLIAALFPTITYGQSGVGISGLTYVSPTFGYSLEWDEDIWEPVEETSESGFDRLGLASNRSFVYLDGAYYYQGDPQECLDGERILIAEQSGVDDLEPLEGTRPESDEESNSNTLSALFELPNPERPNSEPDILFIECRTLIPGAGILVITALLDPDDVETQLLLVDDLRQSIDYSAVGLSVLEPSHLEQPLRHVARQVDAFWAAVFDSEGKTYQPPIYVTFMDHIETDCGEASAGMTGPFYCPVERAVYLDLDELVYRALPYGLIVVQMSIAHEVGHHVQELRQLNGCNNPVCGEIGSSLAFELQADCFAGAWLSDAVYRQSLQSRNLKDVEIAFKSYLADPQGTDQDDPDAHGDGEMRFLMFMEGYVGGASSCGFE